jgi:hypothetical protein
VSIDEVGKALPLPTFSGYRLARLAICDRLSRWERNFVHDLLQRRKLTHRQQAIVDRMVAIYLGTGRSV